MLNFPQDNKYKIVYVEDKTGFIRSDHKNKTLYISKALRLNTTDDGKLRAIFPNFRQKQESGFGCSSSGSSGADCSVDVSNPAKLNYCIQKDGTYHLSGSGVVFNGTNRDDRLILDGTGVGNKIYTGRGNDTFEIQGDSDMGGYFVNNVVDTGDGDDSVSVSGNFYKFKGNNFYLGKGSDKFSASINPNDDAKTQSEFTSKLLEYTDTVSNNKIFATDGKKGWFEENTFESKSYSANQLSEYNNAGAVSEGFQNFSTKPLPKESQPIARPQNTTPQKSKQPTDRERHDYHQKKYQLNSFQSMIEISPKKQAEAQLRAFDAVNDMVNEWAK